MTCIQVSQEAGQVVWYSHVLKNFPQFIVIHTVKGFSVVKEADIFLEFPCFFCDLTDVGNLISGSSAFSKSILNIWKFKVHVLRRLKLPVGNQGNWASLVAQLAGKESACNAEYLASIPGLGRSSGEGNGYPLQYPGLENSMDII